eukprot:1138749-Pelagomonas_calceolata.AAC.3
MLGTKAVLCNALKQCSNAAYGLISNLSWQRHGKVTLHLLDPCPVPCGGMPVASSKRSAFGCFFYPLLTVQATASMKDISAILKCFWPQPQQTSSLHAPQSPPCSATAALPIPRV